MPDSPALSARDEAIAAALREAERPLSAYDLIDLLREQGVTAPTTVYRSLKRLIAAGLAHRLESVNAFVPCARACSHDMAVFAICEVCGTVIEFEDQVVAERLVAWAKSADFHIRSTALELRGRCRSCSSRTQPASI